VNATTIQPGRRMCPRGGAARHWLALLTTLLCALTLLLLSACGGGSAPGNSFVYSGFSTIRYVTWTQDAVGSLTGQWLTLSRVPGQSDPVSSSTGITGHVNQSSITLSVDGDTLTGSLDQGANTLQLQVTSGSGQLATQTWQAATRESYNQLSLAFTASARLHSMLDVLAAAVQTPPSDSSATTYDQIVQFKARDYVDALQQEFSQIQDSLDPCASMALAQFNDSYPPPTGTFSLTPYATAQDAANHTRLSQDLSAVQSEWQRARAAALPSIPGLSTPWVISSQLEAADVQAAQNALTTLEQAIAADYQQMSSLQARAKSMGDQVHRIEQQHGC
jgi:hypothetical protein